MLELSLKAAKNQFFDRQAVLRALQRGEAKALSKVGRYVRKRARTSIRRPRRARLQDLTPEQRRAYDLAALRAMRAGRPAPRLPFASSRPGELPRTPTGILRRSILFVYDRGSRSVVIGPYKLSKGTGAPGVLEYGGTSTLTRGGQTKSVRIAARPYMRPALEAEIAAGTIPRAFRDSVRGGSS